ncbi:MAG: type VI secretion system contractile sheath large subunit [Pirellulaceae bacterium]
MPDPSPHSSYPQANGESYLELEPQVGEDFESESLLDLLVLEANIAADTLRDGRDAPSPSAASQRLAEFSNGQLSTEQALRLWVGDFKSQIAETDYASWKQQAALRLTYHVAEIDRLISEQLNEVLHHARFQALEASWRGLRMLVDSASAEGTRQVRVRVLNVSWREVQRDFERASEFDNSTIFRKVYEEEFGTPGGTPYSMLVGDYEVHPRPTAAHPYDDMATLGHLAGVAAAAFCPFVCGASPSLFGVDNFVDLQHTQDLGRGFLLPEFVKWRSLRKQEDARFVGLAMPRVVMRKPYEIEDTRGFCFQEDVAVGHLGNYLWGNAAYAWAGVLIRTFAQSGWLADIRGTERNHVGGGLVTDLPSISFNTDRDGVGLRSSTDLVVTDQQESALAKLGFLPLCQCHDTPYAAFYSSQSIQEPAAYDDEVATANANISSMLQYMLCVSRFAHYLKVIARDVIGSATEPDEMEGVLDAWIKQYVTPDDSAKPEVKARRPLRKAEVTVSRDPGRPGSFQCTFSLLPHYQLDDLSASIRLQTTMSNRDK